MDVFIEKMVMKYLIGAKQVELLFEILNLKGIDFEKYRCLSVLK